MTREIVVLLALVFACSGCAVPRIPPLESDGWLEIRVRDVAVIGNVAPDELRRLAGELGLFDAVLERVTTAAPKGPRVPVAIYVFAKSAEAKRFTGRADGVLIPTLPGYFAILSAEGPDFTTRQVLFHEYVHYILRKSRRTPYPRWYDEGLSEYLGAIRFRDDAIIVGAAPPSRLASLQHWKPMPLATLFEEGEARRENVYQFYATAWALVHHLNSSKVRRTRLHRFVTRLVAGEDWRSAYAASFEESLETLEAGVADHIERLERGARFDYLVPAEPLLREEYWAEEPMTPSEITYRLGYIAQLMAGRTDGAAMLAQARTLFEESVAHDGTHARALAALARSRAAEGRFDESDELLERAEGRSPADPVIALEAGRIRALRAAATGVHSDAEAACEMLEGAMQLGPELPEVHAELARSYAAAGREAPMSIAAFERARELGPWNPPLDLELARTYLRAGDPVRAEALLVPVAIEVHGEETAREARELLDSIRRNGAGNGAVLKN